PRRGCPTTRTARSSPRSGSSACCSVRYSVQSSGKKEVGVANVLIAIFSEKQSHAVHLLNRAEVTRLDVVNFVSHGLSKIAEEKTAKEETSSEPDRDGD